MFIGGVHQESVSRFSTANDVHIVVVATHDGLMDFNEGVLVDTVNRDCHGLSLTHRWGHGDRS